MSPMKSPLRRVEFLLLAAMLQTAGSGCASVGVRVVGRTTDGGVIAIPNNSDQWPTYYRSRAERLMSRMCPTGYVIDHEEAVTAEPARSRQQASNDTEEYDYNGALERRSRYRRQEYDITFHCAPPLDDMPPDGVPPR